MSNWDYCHFCGVTLSEYAKSKERTVKCLNKNCTASNPVNANYCGVCGIALSEYAKKAQKDDKRNWKQKSELLEQRLSDSNTKNIEQKNKLVEINQQLIKVKNNIEEIENREKFTIIPKWVYYFFSLIGVVFLILLFMYRSSGE